MLADLLIIAGLSSFSYGAWQVDPTFAFIASGSIVFLLGVFMSRGGE